VSVIEEKRLCSSDASHNVKGNSIESACFCVLSFEEKREEWPHLLVGFSPVLGFLGYILCYL
jgi:hypothetical protein